jgi:hypothetical protein
VKLNRHFLWLAAVPALLFFGTGCSGINASQGFSPLSFFLPGIVQAKPVQEKSPMNVSQPGPVKELAKSN